MVSIVWISVLIIAILLFITVDDAAGVGLGPKSHIKPSRNRMFKGKIHPDIPVDIMLKEQNVDIEPLHSPRRRFMARNADVSGKFERMENTPSESIPGVVHPLLRQASSASIGILFGLLIWRSLSSYELADEFAAGLIRYILIAPIVGILSLNVVGLALNLIRPMNFKNHLKVILALNIVREWVEMAYNSMMIVIAFAKSTTLPREVYFGRLFMNVWWSLLCFSFSRSRWVLSASFPQQYQQQQRQSNYPQQTKF